MSDQGFVIIPGDGSWAVVEPWWDDEIEDVKLMHHPVIGWAILNPTEADLVDGYVVRGAAPVILEYELTSFAASLALFRRPDGDYAHIGNREFEGEDGFGGMMEWLRSILAPKGAGTSEEE